MGQTCIFSPLFLFALFKVPFKFLPALWHFLRIQLKFLPSVPVSIWAFPHHLCGGRERGHVRACRRRQGSDIAPPPFTSTFSFRPFYAHAHFRGALFPLLRGQQSPKPTLFTILIRLAAFFSPHLHIPFVTHLTHIHLRLLVPHTSVLSGVFPNLGDLGLLRFPRISLVSSSFQSSFLSHFRLLVFCLTSLLSILKFIYPTCSRKTL